MTKQRLNPKISSLMLLSMISTVLACNEPRSCKSHSADYRATRFPEYYEYLLPNLSVHLSSMSNIQWIFKWSCSQLVNFLDILLICVQHHVILRPCFQWCLSRNLKQKKRADIELHDQDRVWHEQQISTVTSNSVWLILSNVNPILRNA